MKKQSKSTLIFAAVLIILVLVIYAYPRFSACQIYHKVISSRPLALKTLSIEPKIVEFPEANQPCLFSIGYADTQLCPESVNSIRYIHNLGLIFRADSNNVIYFLMPGLPNEVNSTEQKVFGVNDYYDWNVKAAEAKPKKYSEIFFQNTRKVNLYTMLFVFNKINNSFNQRGIEFFETENIKGFLRLGSLERANNNIMAEFFSKDGKITQNVHVTSESQEKSKEAMLSLLSSYRFTIDQADDPNVIEDLILKQFSDNSKFVIEDVNE